MSDHIVKECNSRDFLVVAQKYNLMSKLLPYKQYSLNHLDEFNCSCAKLLAGFSPQTLYGRILRMILSEMMEKLSDKWLDVPESEDPTWSTWYGIPVPMQFTIRSISEHNSSLGKIVERHWSMFIRGLYLDMLNKEYDPLDPLAKIGNNHKVEVTEIFYHAFDLRSYLSLHADFKLIEKYLDRLHNQFSCLFKRLTVRPMLEALVNFVGFKRMDDYRTTEEWVSLLRVYWPISSFEVNIQKEVIKLLREVNP